MSTGRDASAGTNKTEPFLNFADSLLILREQPPTPGTAVLLAHVPGWQGANPRAGQIIEQLPLQKRDIAKARVEAEALGLARIIRPTGGSRQPTKVELAPDITLGPETHSTPVNVRAAKMLHGRGAPAAICLFAVYVREQQIRGAIQLSRSDLAWLLGWPPDTIRRAKDRLVRAGLLVTRDPNRGGTPIEEVPAEYVRPSAAPRDDFWPEATRVRTIIPVGPRHTITVYARPPEAAQLVDAIDRALQTSVEDVLAAELEACTVRGMAHAKDLLAILETEQGQRGKATGVGADRPRGSVRIGHGGRCG